MIDFSKVNDFLKGANAIAQAQQQANAAQAAPPQNAANNPASASQNAANALFAQLGALLNNANAQTPQTADPDLAELQRQAAMIDAKAKALIAKADALESELNLSPTPESHGVDELIAQFKEILQELNKEIDALQKKANERKKANEMKLTQKPTAMKPGEHAEDCSFNQTLTMQ